MRVSHLALDDFRSWKRGLVEFPPGATVLVGANGQGKTNLVEAIAYLSTFSSHRVGAESALVRIPADPASTAPGGAVIRVRLVQAEGREQVVELEIVRGKANRARINRTQVRPREILGLVRTVVFAPEDLALVRGEPAARRAFMDDLVIQRSPVMAGVKADFERVARQRAALMKSAQASARRGASPDLSTLDVWDQQFAHLSARLSAARAQAVASLAGPASRAYDEVSDSPRRLVLSFEASVDRAIGTDPDDPASADPCDVAAQEGRTLAALAANLILGALAWSLSALVGLGLTGFFLLKDAGRQAQTHSIYARGPLDLLLYRASIALALLVIVVAAVRIAFIVGRM